MQVFFIKNRIYIHYASLMMSQKESPMGDSWVIPRKVYKMVWISVSASYYNAGQGTTDWEKKMMGDSWVIPTTNA